MKYEKHEFNFFPTVEADYQAILENMRQSGYDTTLPIMLYDGKILDGWHRYLAACELDLDPVFEIFEGSEMEAFEASIRWNKDRRHLDSSRMAAVAVDSGPVYERILMKTETARRAKQAKTKTGMKYNKNLCVNSLTHKFSDPEPIEDDLAEPKTDIEPEPAPQPKTEPVRAAHEVAKIFGTNRDYITKAEKLKSESPEKFEAVKRGELTIPKAIQEVRKEKTKRLEAEAQETEDIKQTEERKKCKPGEWWELGKHLLFCGDTSTEEFKSRAMNAGATLAFADPPYNAGAAEWDKDFLWKHDFLSEASPIVVVTPGIEAIDSFFKITAMPYKWAVSCWISNGMTRGALGFGNWIFAAIFSSGSIHRNAQDHMQVSIKTSESGETNHKGRKPAAFVGKIIELFTSEGETVIDPFLGSGTTLLVSEKFSRKCIGGEIDCGFCDSIVSRWEVMTGEDAKCQHRTV